MSASPPSYTCGTCGRAYGARPIHCECGARFDRDALTRVQAESGVLGIDVLRVGRPPLLTPCEACAQHLDAQVKQGALDLSGLCADCRARLAAGLAAHPGMAARLPPSR